jgi:hypothetical protein
MSKYQKGFEDIQEMYLMELNDVIEYDDKHNVTEIRRVPGGWIYTFTDKSAPVMTSTFVPFNEEFKLIL